jgi:hypothetical protein
MSAQILDRTESGFTLQITIPYTPGRRDQFWQKLDRWGFPVAA